MKTRLVRTAMRWSAFLLLLILLLILLIGCGPTRIILNHPLDKSAVAIEAVAQEMKFSRVMDGLSISPNADSQLTRSDSTSHPLNYIFTRNDGSEMRLSISGKSSQQTELHARLRLRGVHPASLSVRFFRDCLDQEFAIEAGQQQPFANPRKAEDEFIGWNMLSPVLGEIYMARNNPFVPPALHYYNLVAYGLADAAAWGLIGVGAFGQGRTARNELVGGMALAGIFRFLGLNGLSFIMRYNEYYQMKYQLGI